MTENESAAQEDTCKAKCEAAWRAGAHHESVRIKDILRAHWFRARADAKVALGAVLYELTDAASRLES